MERWSHVSGRSRGMVLVIAAVFVMALSSVVLTLGNLAASARLAQVETQHQLMAQEIAERGLARALAEAQVIASLPEPLGMDFDLMLDPDSDSDATTGEALYLPPASVQGSGTTWGGWGSGTDTVNGQAFRRVAVDLDGDGAQDGAYLVRYDDNRDDTVAGLQYATNNSGAPEGPDAPNNGVDQPLRDRDFGIYVTVIGLAGGTTYATAVAHHLLRTLFTSSTGRALIVGGSYNPGGGGNQELCGNGALVCGGFGVSPSCWCGTLAYSGAAPPFSPGSPATCATPSPCTVCAPQRLDPGGQCPPPLPPDVPQVTVDDAEWMDNFDTSGNTCHFLLADGAGLGGSYTVFIWDPEADGPGGACSSANFPDGTTLPAPDLLHVGGPNFPGDCWVPVYNDAQPGDKDVAGRWTPGSATPSGDIRPVLGDITTRPGGFTTAPPGTRTYANTCGCPGCVAGNSNVLYGFAPGVLRLTDVMPRAIFYSPGNLVLASTGTAVKEGAVVVAGTVDVTAATGLKLKHPHGGHAVLAAGDVVINSSPVGFESGIRSNGAITINASRIRGNLQAHTTITHNGGSNSAFCGGPVSNPVACPSTPPQCEPTPGCLNAGMATFRAVGDITINGNNHCLCANLQSRANITLTGMSNNGALGGTIWAGGNFTAGNNWNDNPVGGGVLGQSPSVAAIQHVTF
ncbi:MAG: hypothetical protein AB2A00_06475 [Myxococcota bacterium]